MHRRIALFCWLLSSPLWAAAEVYKCVDAQNRVSFSQLPCAGEQTSKIVTPRLAASAIGLSDLKLAHYEFTAPDAKAAFLKIRQMGPQSFWGMASWQVTYRYATKQLPSHCKVEDVTTRISGSILMPKWTDVSAAPQSHQKWWADALLGLKHHEDGHIQHGHQLS
jgi:predicted secreted Zn-dependent protease